ncbi:leucine-rich repeat-containing protein 56 isoform X1 [Prionailurus viverrinus]|uniref:leucine-rich repeat-containing protein 56 isoform X1 n=1 Tax=Prionailurus viverrinus TaxID=61388 RepID=UPI001FF43609|nr:leucine-rich repeat-containing protein 56 isoform X1 [Prionailurus viverrinus]XP_047679535.1 leucine-rich repeat-containing protein 56 isoform X1 [Prionailurus viverrinus]XP_047679536.1 leucine-rich repeat-containing protein 56 isoform X1 [Prionailurus viverrinus]XP_047679537.1 leucine-rich repeat-containing protein 56 isoform X1 [Prionailurus viverrinus]XP_047679538.1 leucine-rich repeat-containing protein 56 isoform X1 [Prionailurus viverrinus]XP_047679539.1 leucine-rich repeat-containing
MDQAWDKAHRPWPSTADILVRELSWQGPHNPCPKSKDPGSHGEQLVEEYLSPARLRALAQVDDLRLVGMLEMCVSTRESSLGNFGVHLPNLSQLKLNGSCLGSVRDLGTSLGRLRVLWLARCGLTDLDGIGCFPALKELYVSYNNISDLSPLCLLEQLEVLDLEGNSVEVLEQVRYLQLCPRLATLTLEGNLVCLRPGPSPSNEVPPGYNYRAEVRKLVPQLRVLDEVPATHTAVPAPRELRQDWLMVKEAIKEGSVYEGLFPGLDHPHGAPIRTLGSQLSLPETQPRAPRPRPLSLLVTGGPLPGGLLPKDPAPQDDTSNLTHGGSRVLCGNPTKGLRERRHQCQAWTPPEQLAPQEDLAASASTPGPDPADSSDLLALARLQARRELHLRRYLESQQEGATAPRGPRGAPEEQEDESKPRTPSGPQCLVPESSRTSGCNLIPSPPKFPLPSDSSNTFWGSTDLQFRRRRLRALGSLRPGLGQGLAAVTALRGLEVASGPNPRAQGCPSPKPAPDPAARPPRPPVRAAPEPYHPSPIPPLV